MIAIYGNKNGTQDSIAWWLCEEEDIGPQIYNVPWRSGKIQAEFEHPLLGTLVEDIRTYDEHDETMRLMENVPGDFLQPWRKFDKQDYKLVWSNYFGEMCEPSQNIIADKLILCNQTREEDCFHYIISHAFKKLTKDKVDDDTEVWWKDHVYVDGKDIGMWKDIWYGKYNESMHKAFDEGKLKYMWQLNFAHWDLYHALQDNKVDVTLEDPDNYTRLFEDKLKKEYDSIEDTIMHNDGLIIVDPNWFVQADQILEYLEIPWTDNLKTNLNDYMEVYKRKRMWYETNFADYL